MGEQEVDAAFHGIGIHFAQRHLRKQRPRRGLRRTNVMVRAAQGRIDVAVVRFAPTAIGVLTRAQPFDGFADIRLARIFTRQGESAEHAPRAIDVIAAPATPPAAIFQLRAA